MSSPAEYVELSQGDQRELVIKHANLVKRIAYHLIGRMPPCVDVDDLIQSGMIGLLLAGRNYSANRGANFETYAGIRIRGAMIDEVRKSDWTPRSVHRKIREVSVAISAIENRSGVKAKNQDVADALEISIEEYLKILRDAAGSRLFSLDGFIRDDGASSQIPRATEREPLELLEEESRRQRLMGLIEELPERERRVMSLYYDEELNLREIGEVLGVSESRVCQIHGLALMRLRANIDE